MSTSTFDGSIHARSMDEAPAKGRKRAAKTEAKASGGGPKRPVEVDTETRRRAMRRRITVLMLLVLSGAIAVVARAYRIQIVEGDRHRATAEAQQHRDLRVAPKRGTIYDRHGAELAVSVDVESVYANPREMRAHEVDIASVATQLANVLGVDRERIAHRLASDRLFAWMERQVTPEEAEAVRSLHIPGVEIVDEARRYYPNRELAAHILGFSNVDGRGIEGLELAMDESLRGSTSSVSALRDRRGRVVYSEQLFDDGASLGHDVALTIDKTIQHIVERELALTVRTFEAQAGSVVVMDPNTGEILAAASYPTFDPNRPGESPAASRRFRAIADRFEPGSTVKPFTIAAALAAGVVRANEQFDCQMGAMEVAEYTIHDSHPFGLLTPAEILAHSSNIGSAKIGFRLGRQGLYRAFRRFGFGQATDLPLRGEAAGNLRHHSAWYDMDLATISFGQGLSVTTMQLATAMSTIANGGRLMRPILVSRVTDGHGDVIEEARPEVRRQVVPRQTARLVADMLTAVTGDEGTGAEAAIPGYLVAGKTGTAQKANEGRAGYSENRWLSSFVGFVPADAPRLVIAVVIDEPVIDHYGGVVAGPVFRRVGEATLQHLGVPPSGGGTALTDLEDRPRASRTAVAGRTAARVPAADEASPGEGQVRVPELVGQTMRGAYLALTSEHLVPEFEGTGLVRAQTPEAGTIVDEGATIAAILERPSGNAVDDAPEASAETPTEPAEAATTTTTEAPSPRAATPSRTASSRAASPRVAAPARAATETPTVTRRRRRAR